MSTSAKSDERQHHEPGPDEWVGSRSGRVMRHTDPVMPEMSGPTAPDDASFTLPTRPGVLLLEHPRVDLLARETARRHLPEGAAAGFGVIGALVLFSCLVGGLTAGLVVVGVSALLSVSAALVTGHLSLAQAGGQRGANLLLGVGAAALILGSVVSQQTRPAPDLAGTPVPVSSGTAVKVPSVPAPATSVPSRPVQGAADTASQTVPAQAAEATQAAGLTLSPDALAPRPAQVEVVPAEAADLPTDAVRGNGKGAEKAAVPAAHKAKGASTSPAKAKAKGAGNGKGKAVGKGKGAHQPTGPHRGAPKATGKTGGTVAKAPKTKVTAKPAAPLRHGLAGVRSAVHDLL